METSGIGVSSIGFEVTTWVVGFVEVRVKPRCGVIQVCRSSIADFTDPDRAAPSKVQCKNFL
jgi:hypothetical protein